MRTNKLTPVGRTGASQECEGESVYRLSLPYCTTNHAPLSNSLSLSLDAVIVEIEALQERLRELNQLKKSLEALIPGNEDLALPEGTDFATWAENLVRRM